jgi:N-acetylneuraminic acid mutarotase
MSEAANFTTITWTTRTASPIARTEALGAAVDQKLYVFGGYTSSTSTTPTKRADVYDSVSDTWTQIKNLPTGLSHAGVASDGHDVYFAGGYPEKNGGGQTFATSAVWKYNVDTNSYTAMPGLPQARGGGALVRLDRDLHFFGGSNAERTDASTHWFLSLDNLSAGWFVAAPMLSATNHLGGAALGGLIYAVGGQQGQNEASVIQKSVQVFDPSTDTWKMVQSLPTPRGHIASATFVMGGRIIVAGGEPAHGSTTRKVTAYNPAIDSWTELTPLPLSRSSGVAGQVGSVIMYSTGSLTKTTYRGVPGS